MKTKRLSIKQSVAIFCVIILVLIIACVTLGTISARAETASEDKHFVGLSGDNCSDLYDLTNKYKYKGDFPQTPLVKDEKDKNGDDIENFYLLNSDGTEGDEQDILLYRTHEFYDMTKYNPNVKVESKEIAPRITVLTHGLGGRASDWGNTLIGKKYGLAYDSDSLFAKIASITGGNVYLAEFTGYKKFNFVNISKDSGNYDEKTGWVKEKENYTTIKQLSSTDAENHMVIIFKCDRGQEYNNYTYEQFNYMLSKILYDYKYFNHGVLPRINLIGHSRGGITNLQYALDHPDLVDSMFSMGTPYFGSDSAASIFGKLMYKDGDRGRSDVVDEDLYSKIYYNRWMGKDKDLYKDINVHALGGYYDFDTLCETLLIDAESLSFLHPALTRFITINIMGAINTAKIMTFGKSSVVGKLTTDILPDLVETIIRLIGCNENEYTALIRVLSDIELVDFNKDANFWDFLMHNFLFFNTYFMNDFAVDLPSQLGVNNYRREQSYNFNTFTKLYSSYKLVTTKYARNIPTFLAVPHNLEARDPDFIHYILKNIRFGGGNDVILPYSLMEDDTYEIYGIYGEDIKNGVFTIPSQINDKKVTKISNYAFVNSEESFHTVIIPATITEIGEFAFSGCKDLQKIVFEEKSSNDQSLNFDYGCFAGCENLESLILPKQTRVLNGFAFGNCSTLKTIMIPKNTLIQDATVFAGCTQLGEIVAEDGHEKYTTQDGVLLSREGDALIAYPQGKVGSSYTVPYSVKEIKEYAFCGTPLISININQVEYMRDYAFYGCTNLDNITADNLLYATGMSLIGTKWYGERMNDEFVSLGKVLLAYNGEDEYLTLDGYSSIASFAIHNPNLKDVALCGESLFNIGEYAFYECSELETVGITRTSGIVYLEDDVFSSLAENFVVYVPEKLYTRYISDMTWEEYSEYIQKQEVDATVDFDTDGGNKLKSMRLFADKPVSKMPIPVKTGYVFNGWEKNEEVLFERDLVLLNKVTHIVETRINLKARWQQTTSLPQTNTYTFVFDSKGGQEIDSITFNSEEEITKLPVPERLGYIFLGWTNKQGSGVVAGFRTVATDENGIITQWDFPILPTVGDTVIYLHAEWDVQPYSISYDTNYPKDVKEPVPSLDMPTVYYITSVIELPELSVPNYRFMGWLVKSDQMSITMLVKNIEYGTYGNLRLTAVFEKLYKIEYYIDGKLEYTDTAISGEVFKVYSPEKTGKYAAWNKGINDGPIYAGDKYTMGASNIMFFLSYWESYSYTVSLYYAYGSYAHLNDVEVKYDMTFSFEVPSASTNMGFVGWYAYDEHNTNLPLSYKTRYTNRFGEGIGIWKEARAIKLIAEFVPITVTVTNATQRRIDDKDNLPTKQNDAVGFGLVIDSSQGMYEMDEYYRLGYSKLTIEVKFEVKEIHDGYQWIDIYFRTANSDKKITCQKVEHGKGIGINTKWGYHTVVFEIELTEEMQGNLYVYYGASGTGADDWYCRNVTIGASLS